ncbi:hypothetical protein BC834DRAFT_668441 [Gloeopeniophorella convolvens]|nr:hypothetical protein BC834DRAFT_668441 [Gloeopeniophorella convolvens]
MLINKIKPKHLRLTQCCRRSVSSVQEYLICKLDAPALENLYVDIVARPPITIPSLSRFISNLVPRVTARNEARLSLIERLFCVEILPVVSNDTSFWTIYGDSPRLRFCIHYDDWVPHLPTLMATIPAICQPFAPALSHVDTLFIECGDFINQDEPVVEVPYTEGWDAVLALFPNTTDLDVEASERRDVLQALQRPSDVMLLPNLKTITFPHTSRRIYNLLSEVRPLLDARRAVGRLVNVCHRYNPSW